jgi:hypothetical protein
MKIALWLIAACHMATTLDVYRTDEGGLAVFVGNFGYYFATQGE